MADREYLPQLMKDFLRQQEQDDTRKTRELLEEYVRLQQESAEHAIRDASAEELREVEEKARLARLPKCPECQTPLEGNRQRRCAACCCSLYWVLSWPLGARQIMQILDNPAEHHLLDAFGKAANVTLTIYGDLRRDAQGFAWLPSTLLSARALSAHAEKTASSRLAQVRHAVSEYTEAVDTTVKQLKRLRARLSYQENAAVMIVVWWGFFSLCYIGMILGAHPFLVSWFLMCTALLLIFTPLFLIGLRNNKKKQASLQAQISPLQEALHTLSLPRNVQLLCDGFIFFLQLDKAKSGSADCFSAGDRVDVYVELSANNSKPSLVLDDSRPGESTLVACTVPFAVEVGSMRQYYDGCRTGLWTKWRDSLGEELRQVYEAITCITAVNGLKQLNWTAKALLQDLHDSSQALGRTPPDIPKLNEILAKVQEILAGGSGDQEAHPRLETTGGGRDLGAKTTDSDSYKHEAVVSGVSAASGHMNADVSLLLDALTLLAASDRRVSSVESKAIASTMAGYGVVMSNEEHLQHIEQVVAKIKTQGVTAFANTLRDSLFRHRNARFHEEVLKAMVTLSQRDGVVHEHEARVIAWLREQLANKPLQGPDA